jgi:flagellar FliL protein
MAKKAAKKGKGDAAPAAEGAAGAPAEGGKLAFLKNKKVLMFGGGLAAVLLATGGVVWWLGLLSPRPPAQDAQARPPGQEVAAGAPGTAGATPAQRTPPVFIDLPDMTVNLATQGQRNVFLRARIALELTNATAAAQVQPLMPRVLDTFQTFLREMRPADLEGSAAIHRLREELTRRVNLAVAPGRVDAVLFRELLVQ